MWETDNYELFRSERIISGYVNAIADTPDKGMTRKQSWLPCSKEKIVTAYKIFMSHVLRYNTLTKEQFEQYMILLNFIDSFVKDEEAIIIDNFYNLNNEEMQNYKIKSPEQFEYGLNFATKVNASDKYDEVVSFIHDVQNLDKDDPLYCQKIYSLANLEYRPEYKRCFEGGEEYEEQQLETFTSFQKVFSQYMVMFSMFASILGVIGYFMNRNPFTLEGCYHLYLQLFIW